MRSTEELIAALRDEAVYERFRYLMDSVADRLASQAAEIERLKEGYGRELNEVEQHLGKALGYPELYPHVSDVDDGTVCIGEHVAGTIAHEAANRIIKQRAEIEQLKAPWTEGEVYAASAAYLDKTGCAGCGEGLIRCTLNAALAVRVKGGENG